MKFTIDIHTKLLGIIACFGLVLIGIYQYQTKVAGQWPHAEVLDLTTVGIFSFFMLMPFFVALLGNRKDLEVQEEELAEMGKLRKILNSPKSIETVYFGMMYLLTTTLIYGLLSEAINW